MLNDIGVSILCLAYNHGPYIRDAIEGFLKQETSFEYEIIIHDDASTDDTADIIREYQRKYPDIIKPIFQTENQYSKHVSINAEFFLPNAKGKYVALCDGDDYWTDPQKLQKQFDVLEANPDCFMCLHRVIDLDTVRGTEKYLPQAEIPTGVLDQRTFFSYLGKLDFFNEVCYFFNKEKYCEYQYHYPEFASLYMKNLTDDAPMLNYFGTIGKVYYLADAMAVYRRFNQGSWSHNMTQADKEKKKTYFANVVQAQKAFDEFSHHEYDSELTYSRTYFRFNYHLLSGDYRELVKPEYRCILEKMSKQTQMRIKLMSRGPVLFGAAFRLYDALRGHTTK